MTENPFPFSPPSCRAGTATPMPPIPRGCSQGRHKIAQNVAGEAVELAIAAAAEPDKIVPESADLLYHLLVLWADAGVAPDAVWRELEARGGTSGLEEKARRPKA